MMLISLQKHEVRNVSGDLHVSGGLENENKKNFRDSRWPEWVLVPSKAQAVHFC